MSDDVQMLLINSKWTSEHCIVPGGKFYPGTGNEYCFPLILGENLLSNAKSWGHYSTDPEHGDIIFGLQCLIMAIDDDSLGAFTINVPKKANPYLYKRVIDSLVKRNNGTAQKMDYDIIKKHCGGSKWINVDHQIDLKEAIEKAKQSEKEKDEDDDEYEGDQPRKRKKISRLNIYDDPRFQQQYFCGLLGPNYYTVDLNLEGMPEYTIFPDDEEPDVEPDDSQEVVIVNTEEEHQENDSNNIDVLLSMLEDDRRTLPKARFTLTPVYREGTNDDLIGYLVRIIQVDPSWNPGQMIQKLIRHREIRERTSTRKFYEDPFLKYYPLRHTRFPVFSISQPQWVHMRNKMEQETSTSNLLKHQYGEESVEVYDHSIHPCNMFTLKYALEALVNAGADSLIFNVENFKPQDRQGFTWPGSVHHYEYLPNQVFWFDPFKLGLLEMTFPNVKLTNDALRMYNQLDTGEDDSDHIGHELDELCSNNEILIRDDVLTAMPPIVGIPTKNVILLTAADADETMHRINTQKPKHYKAVMRKLLVEKSIDIHDDRVQECILYSEMVHASHDHYMRQFESIFNLESNVTYVSIPETLKVLLRWLQANFKKKSITRFLRKFDADMTLFGNAIMRHCILLERVLKLVQPTITLKTEGAFSVYARRRGQLLFNYCNYGGKDKGKTFTVINGGQAQMVPDSYTTELLATDAAYNTEIDLEHIILFRDEIEEWIVNPKLERGKDAKKANVKKAVMTSGEFHMKVFENKEIPGTNKSVRTARNIAARRNMVEFSTTNYSVEKGVGSGALVSRYFMESMKSCMAPIEQYNWKVDPKHKKEAKNWFCLNQVMTAIVEQAMTMSAIVCDPTMTLWKDISARILDSLRNMGIINRDDGVRGLEKLNVFARQLVVKMAIHYTYDAPGAPCYGQLYHPSQLKILQRYLYFNTEYAVYLYPLLISEFIDEDCGIVLKAACKLLHISDEMDPYEQYTTVSESRRHFGRKYNSKYTKDDLSNGPREWIDLNYFQIEGKIDSVCQQIAEKTVPKMDVSMVKGVLNVLQKKQFTPKKVFKVVDPSEINVHIRRTVDKLKISSRKIDECIHIKAAETGFNSSQIHDLQTEYLGKSIRDTFSKRDLDRILKSITYADKSIFDIEDSFERANALNMNPFHVHMILAMFDFGCVHENGTSETYTYIERQHNGRVPSVDNLETLEQSISVVRYENAFKGHTKIMFSAEAIRLFNPDAIIDAMEDAIICSTTTPGKRIIGFASKEDITKLRTVNWTKEFIDESVKVYDETFPDSVSRTEGLVFNRRGYMTRKVMNIMMESSSYIDEELANPIQVVNDVNFESAFEHHLKCPNPTQEPIRSPQYIEDAYNDAINNKKVAKSGHGTLDYPEGLIKEKKMAMANFWKQNEGATLKSSDRERLRKLKR